jgi:hypothetical protein
MGGGQSQTEKPAPEAEPKPGQRVPVKTTFRLDAIDNDYMFTHDKPMPHRVLTDINEIEMKCELCLELPCCPDHCCDVSENQT